MLAETLWEVLRQARILIVDDEVSSTRLLSDILRVDGYQYIHAINDARYVLSHVIEFQPDLVIMDLQMPYLDGFQLLEMMKGVFSDAEYLPVLIVSAESNYQARRRALTSGATDFLVKPYIADEVMVRIANMLRLRFQNRHLVESRRLLEQEAWLRTQELEGYQLALKEAQLEVIMRLACAAEHRDDDTGKHTQRVGLASSLIAQTLGLAQHDMELIASASPLHDVGKIGVPDSVLLKHGPLTETERKIMQRHCLVGAELLSGGHSEVVLASERIARTHHERWDGSGYPDGASGEEICLEGRIVAVADVFDALTHHRPYKRAWTIEAALAEIRAESGRQFDPAVVEAFLQLPHEELL